MLQPRLMNVKEFPRRSNQSIFYMESSGTCWTIQRCFTKE